MILSTVVGMDDTSTLIIDQVCVLVCVSYATSVHHSGVVLRQDNSLHMYIKIYIYIYIFIHIFI